MIGKHPLSWIEHEFNLSRKGWTGKTIFQLIQLPIFMYLPIMEDKSYLETVFLFFFKP